MINFVTASFSICVRRDNEFRVEAIIHIFHFRLCRKQGILQFVTAGNYSGQ